MTPRVTVALFLVLLALRLQHRSVLWVEEAYPTAAAIQILAGRVPYVDFWFDKPPLFAYLYTLWSAETGALLRIAGAAYVTLCAWLMARVAGHAVAGLLLAFFLTFDVASAVMVLGPDLLLIAPVLGVVLLRDAQPWRAGFCLAIGFHLNTKALLFAPLLGSWTAALWFAAFCAPVFAWPGYAEQVWQWGSLYARDTFVAQPVQEALRKTGAWLGFHAALVIAAVRARWDRPSLLWLGAACVAVAAGLRFFPRYYFALLPVACLLAARGWPRWGRWRWALLMLLALPLARYAPGYWRVEGSRDLAMFRDAREAARVVQELARPGDTIFVWGYRPEIDALTRLPGATPYLESQPLTGVFADRHLVSDKTSSDGAVHRRALAATRPTFLVDGLGRYNPRLAIARYPELAEWLRQYEVIALTRGSVIYRIRTAASGI